MENFRIKNIIISKQPEDSENLRQFVKIINNKKINIIYVKKGDKLKVEKNVYFDVLQPDINNFIKENPLNNNSIVGKLFYNSFSCLFTGDIEKEAEQHLVEQYKGTKDLNSTVLKVAHHGSKTSSTIEFLNQVLPRISIIGVGKNNLYGHPNKEVLERLDNLRCKNI